jgi:hypothetical protein
MKKIFCSALILFVAITLILQVKSSYAITVRIENPKVLLKLKPGEVISGTLGVQNPETHDAIVRIYAEDWKFNEKGTGEKDFFAPRTLEDGASHWISLNPSEAHIPKYGRRDIHYTLTVPKESVSGTYHAVVFFETTVGERPTEEGASVTVAARLGTIFAIEITGKVERNGEITSIEINPSMGNKPLEVMVTFQNTGSSDIELKGNLMIVDSSGQIRGRGELNSIHTQKGMVVTRKSEWAGKLSPGNYDVIFTFDLGEGKIITEERTMKV